MAMRPIGGVLLSVRAWIALGILCGSLLVALLVRLSVRDSQADTPAERDPADVIWAAASPRIAAVLGSLDITYPLDEAVFPPDIVEPTFHWRDEHPAADTWLTVIEPADGKEPIRGLSNAMQWTPSPEQWRDVTARSVESRAKVTVVGVNGTAPATILSAATIRVRTSADVVGAPLFYREVNLPFSAAVADPAKYIRWRFGPISARRPPPVVLEKLPVCGNCHSFSADGAWMGLDVDYANDKGSYVLSRVEERISLDPGKILTWSDYQRDENEPTFGLLSQVSPDGNHVISTVKDRSVFVPKPEIEFSQLFFPIRGILAVYSRRSKTFCALPGADDPQYVQSNPAWSPDGRFIVFARSKAYRLGSLRDRDKVLLTRDECREFLKDGKTFQFDLYRIPFNEGRGGRAEPLSGASNNGMSNYFAKYSPDGKWIVFCRAKSFMLLQPDSELYIIPAAGGEARRLSCNTGRMNSWHSWSPNSRWLVFSSKIHGPYTRLFLTHVDGEGNSTPPVVLDRFTSPELAANIPEFVNRSEDSIREIREQFVDDHSHRRAGDAMAKEGDWSGAMRMYRQALGINPRSFEAHAGLGNVLRELGKLDEAVLHWEQAVQVKPESAEAHYALGNVLGEKRRKEEAIAHWERAVQLKPDFAAAHNNLGSVLSRYGRIEQAIAHYRQALTADPELADAHYNLGLELDKQGQWKEALEHFRKVVEIRPSDAEAHDSLGAVLARTGKLEEGIEHFARAVQLKPDYSKARINLEKAQAIMRGPHGAVRRCEDAVKQHPDSAGLQRKLGDALLEVGEVGTAIEHIERAVQLDPKNADDCNHLAWLLAARGPQHEGYPAKAVSLAKRACELTQNQSADCMDTLAAAYAAAGLFPEAVATAEKALGMASTAGKTQLAKAVEERLKLYRSGNCYVEPAPPVRRSEPWE